MAYSQQSCKCALGSRGCGKVAISTHAIEGLITEIVGTRPANTDMRCFVDVPEPLNDAQRERERLEGLRSKFYDLSRTGQNRRPINSPSIRSEATPLGRDGKFMKRGPRDFIHDSPVIAAARS